MQIVSYCVGAWGLYPCYKTYSLWIKWIWVTWFCPVFDLYRWWCSGSADWYATQVRRGTCHLLFFPRTFPYFWPPSPSVTWITLHVELVFASRSSQISHMPVSREIFPFFPAGVLAHVCDLFSEFINKPFWFLNSEIMVEWLELKVLHTHWCGMKVPLWIWWEFKACWLWITHIHTRLCKLMKSCRDMLSFPSPGEK